jgi:hypothetical protein
MIRRHKGATAEVVGKAPGAPNDSAKVITNDVPIAHLPQHCLCRYMQVLASTLLHDCRRALEKGASPATELVYESDCTGRRCLLFASGFSRSETKKEKLSFFPQTGSRAYPDFKSTKLSQHGVDPIYAMLDVNLQIDRKMYR